ncbi:galactose mutarotase (plasmid) [Polymorphobacter sp. PAMC 29334]|uniref:aldose epimerase family protein n=1 Tax=Polymorphobacter sp. PAMC 29334 TaxID=2862331 RepID=UPI001C66AB34|nr:aldose epimerase family protein [Polymorphobacter sp. PAMC 29334]QYE33260.1 galactose mutarotase [Polymorphobacter sp. PAMC 29334]
MKLGKLTKLTAAATLTAMASMPAAGVEVARSVFGTLPDGRAVPSVTLTNRHGVAVTVIGWGAAIQSLVMPDRNGHRADVALGYAALKDYLGHPQYFGATVGRFANRIAGARFTLDGNAYQVPVNDGPNSLHGGTAGFDKQLWTVVDTAGGASGHVTLRHVSVDGEQGYPGTLTVDATYTLGEDDRLTIEYRATTDRPTIVNVTNHSYWNLGGEGSTPGAMGHLVTIAADSYLPTNATAIPTGEVRPVAGTAFDFRTPHAVGERVRDATDQQLVFGRGYDHNWIVGRTVTADEHLMARAVDPASGRGFELWSNQPGLQFYSGNFLDGTSAGKAKRIYRGGDAIVFEPQIFPDTPNQPAFGLARLAPGEVYRNVMTYRLSWGAAR